MEPEHPEDDRNYEAGTFDEEEAVCNQPQTNKVSGRSIIFLKNRVCEQKSVNTGLL